MEQGSNPSTSHRIEVFHDGDCPLCEREINMLRRLDRGKDRIRFTDITDPSFDALSIGKTHEDLMARIHGRLPSGEFIEGVEVFRELYQAVGFGFLVAPTRLPGVAPMLDSAYRWFAKNRLKLTGRNECNDGLCVPASERSDQARIETRPESKSVYASSPASGNPTGPVAA
ncbi:MAG: DUF393 domain-containing protein [Myxococcota bacterium]